MKVYALMSTSDPYEPRNVEGVYATKEVAEKYMNVYLDKETKGDAQHRASLIKDNDQFGPSVCIDEIDVIEG